MSRVRKVYYLQIDGAGRELEIQEARKHLYRLGSILRFGKGTAVSADAGWVVLYTARATVEELRRALVLIGWNDRVSWVVPAASLSEAVAVSRQLPLFHGPAVSA